MSISRGVVVVGEYSGWKVLIEDGRYGDTAGYYFYLNKNDAERFDCWFKHEAGLQTQLVDFEVEWID